MKKNIAWQTLLLISGLSTYSAAQAISVDWAYWQTIHVPHAGLTEIQIPPESLSNAQPSLGDLRLLNSNQQEMSFFINRPTLESSVALALSSLNMRMEKGHTVVTGQVPKELLARGVDAICLYTLTDDFLKAFTLETSADKRIWKTLVKSYPIFKQPGQSQSISVDFPKIHTPYLRITLDDATSPPIRILSVGLYSASKKMAFQAIAPKILGITSDSHQTDIRLQLPGSNLMLDSVEIETSQASFKRPVTGIAKVFSGGDLREQALGHGTIYRVPLANHTAQRLSIPLDTQVSGREFILRIENGDSLPLDISNVTVRLVPTFVVFDAPGPGDYALWLGNASATAKNYDVSSFRDQISQKQLQQAQVGSLAKNPAFKKPDVLPEVQDIGSEIDIGAWQYRKKIQIGQSGLQRVELDPQTLAHDENRLVDVRLVRNGKQLPYVLDRSGAMRQADLRIETATTKDKKSQWTLVLPVRGFPFSSLVFKIQEPLFQREMAIYEEVPDDRGDTIRQDLGWVNWIKVSSQAEDEFVMNLNRSPRGDHLILETNNGDNPQIHISQVRGYYQAPRIFFKASQGPDLYLYYGQANAGMPQYDLNLIAGEILSIQPNDVTLSQEEVLKVQPWWQPPVPSGGMKYLFWAVLGLVVAALLYAIAKLLPAETQTQ